MGKIKIESFFSNYFMGRKTAKRRSGGVSPSVSPHSVLMLDIDKSSSSPASQFFRNYLASDQNFMRGSTMFDEEDLNHHKVK